MVTENLTHEPPRGTKLDRVASQVARNSRTLINLFWAQEKRNMQRIYKLTRNQIMRPIINAFFVNNSAARTEWLQEYFLPGDKLASFLKFLGEVLDENNVALLNASVRFVKQDNLSKMGYAAHGDRFAVVLFFSQSLNPKKIEKTKRWIQKVVDRTNKDGGSFYLPYAHFPTVKQFQKSYPAWEEVLKETVL